MLKCSRFTWESMYRTVQSTKMWPVREESIKWDAYVSLNSLVGTTVLTPLVFHKETYAHENVHQFLFICFQRQTLKADHAKRSRAHREEIHSVVLKILTTILTAKLLPRYGHLLPGIHLAASFYFSFFSLSLCSCVLVAVFSGGSDFGIHSPLCLFPPPPLPCVAGGGESVGILISQQKDFPPPRLACWVKDRWLSAHVIEAEIS